LARACFFGSHNSGGLLKQIRTAYIADDGAFVHPLQDKPNARLTDRDLMVYALKAGYGRKGAKIGSRPGEAELFRDDMLAFWKRLFGKPS
jgi:hypothetical protein